MHVVLPDPYPAQKQTVFGVKVQQSPLALWAWEHVLAATRPRVIVEIGTANGGLTLWLGAWARLNRARVLSFDIHDQIPTEAKEFLATLPVQCVLGDVFADPNRHLVATALSSERPGLVYCDGGNKPRELAYFRNWIPSGSYIGCHDYTIDVAMGLADQLLTHNGFEQIFDGRQWHTLQAFWRRKEADAS